MIRAEVDSHLGVLLDLLLPKAPLRDFRFVSELVLLWSSSLSVRNDVASNFRATKTVLLQDSQIFRIQILLNFCTLFLEAFHLHNLDILESLKECTLEVFFQKASDHQTFKSSWDGR